MLRTSLLASFLAQAVAPAVAQDFATQYADAARAFMLPGMPSGLS
jgi:hypothetical protein